MRSGRRFAGVLDKHELRFRLPDNVTQRTDEGYYPSSLTGLFSNRGGQGTPLE